MRSKSKKLHKPIMTIMLDVVPNLADEDYSCDAVCVWLDPGDGIRRLFSQLDKECWERAGEEPLSYIMRKTNEYKELASNLGASFRNNLDNDALEEFVNEAESE